MRLVDHDQIPFRHHELVTLTSRELEGTDHDRGLLEGAKDTLLAQAVIGAAFEDNGREEELLGQLLRPLFAEVRWADDENATLPFGPFLGQTPSPASIVFPRPTSSARMAPLARGDLNAKSAAST